MAGGTGDHQTDSWSPEQRDGDTVVPMPRALYAEKPSLEAPQFDHKESIAEGLPCLSTSCLEYTSLL